MLKNRQIEKVNHEYFYRVKMSNILIEKIRIKYNRYFKCLLNI